MNKDIINEEGEFILPFWNAIFGFLERLSIFYLVRKFKVCKTYRFVELWVLGNLILSILFSHIAYNFQNRYLSYGILIYGLIRVFEVVIYQINVLIFHPYRAAKKGKKYFIKSPFRMVVLLLHNYIEIIFWFMSIYISMLVIGNNVVFESWGTYLKLSSFCFVSSDLTILEAKGFLSSLAWVAYIEVISGLIMTIISLGRFIGTLPNVTRD